VLLPLRLLVCDLFVQGTEFLLQLCKLLAVLCGQCVVVAGLFAGELFLLTAILHLRLQLREQRMQLRIAVGLRIRMRRCAAHRAGRFVL
jgi:hypothetical protein